MALNYAEQWSPELLEILMQGTLTSPFVTSNVRWLDAKTFHFTQMSTSGYKNHRRRCSRVIQETCRMKVHLLIIHSPVRAKSALCQQRHMPAVCTFIRNITFRQRRIRTQRANGTRTGSRRTGQHRTLLRKHSRNFIRG